MSRSFNHGHRILVQAQYIRKLLVFVPHELKAQISILVELKSWYLVSPTKLRDKALQFLLP